MKKALSIIIKLISLIAVIAVVCLVVTRLSDLVVPKPYNRYYILEKYLEEHPEHYDHDVQVFGSCHSYTSFNPEVYEAQTGDSAFVYSNAGEIIPVTYLRMLEQFRRHTPKIAFVEIWGINPYDTYDTLNSIFGNYMPVNLERIPFSMQKMEVISDFKHHAKDIIDYVPMSFPLYRYKERLIGGQLTELDWHYDFEKTKAENDDYTFNEMTSRLSRNGFKANPSIPIEDYPYYQTDLYASEIKEIEPDIVKYIQKIIDLCKANNVTLVFYRSPYISNENEIGKNNHLRQICDSNQVYFYDLEQEIEYDYSTDFIDYDHLSAVGAEKSTAFLASVAMSLESIQEESPGKHNLPGRWDGFFNLIPKMISESLSDKTK